jgi:transposase
MPGEAPCQVAEVPHQIWKSTLSIQLWRKENMNKARRTFTPEFKAQMVKLYENGKPRKDIISEYDLTPSALDKWVKQNQTSGSFKEKDNRTPEEAELIKLRKENQRLLMENDILKQAALIIGRK